MRQKSITEDFTAPIRGRWEVLERTNERNDKNSKRNCLTFKGGGFVQEDPSRCIFHFFILLSFFFRIRLFDGAHFLQRDGPRLDIFNVIGQFTSATGKKQKKRRKQMTQVVTEVRTGAHLYFQLRLFRLQTEIERKRSDC